MTENSFTKPYESIEEAYCTQFPAKKSGRPRGATKLTEKEITEIKAAEQNVTHKELAKNYGVSISTIERLRR